MSRGFRRRCDRGSYRRDEHGWWIGSLFSLLHVRKLIPERRHATTGKFAGETFHEGVMHPRPCTVRQDQNPFRIIRSKEHRPNISNGSRYTYGHE